MTTSTLLNISLIFSMKKVLINNSFFKDTHEQSSILTIFQLGAFFAVCFTCSLLFVSVWCKKEIIFQSRPNCKTFAVIEAPCYCQPIRGQKTKFKLDMSSFTLLSFLLKNFLINTKLFCRVHLYIPRPRLF